MVPNVEIVKRFNGTEPGKKPKEGAKLVDVGFRCFAPIPRMDKVVNFEFHWYADDIEIKKENFSSNGNFTKDEMESLLAIQDLRDDKLQYLEEVCQTLFQLPKVFVNSF